MEFIQKLFTNYLMWQQMRATLVLFSMLSIALYIHAMEPETGTFDFFADKSILDAALIAAIQELNVAEVKNLLSQGANADALGAVEESFNEQASPDALVVIEEGADPNARNLRSALLIAVRTSYDRQKPEPGLEIIKLLIQNGAHIDVLDAEGHTPLMLASLLCEIAVMELFLSRGADVNASSKSGETSLILVASNRGERAPRAMKLLLEAGAKVNQQDELHRTALHIAFCASGLEEMVELLLSYDADVTIEDIEGHTPIILASKSEHFTKDIKKKIISMLRGKINLNNRSEKGDTHWREIMFNLPGCDVDEDLEIVDLFIDGSTINSVNRQGFTPLRVAIEKDYYLLARHLIKRGAIVDAQDLNGITPLRAAIEKNDDGIADLLLENGARVDREDSAGITPLMAAVKKGTDIGKVLLEYSPSMNAQDLKGKTALVWAAQRGNLELLKLFILKHNADVNVLKKVWDFKKYANVNHALVQAAYKAHYDCVKFLLQSGARIEHIGYIDYSERRINQLLLAYGADLRSTPFAKAEDVGLQDILNRGAFENNVDVIVASLGDTLVDEFNYEHPLIIASGCGHKEAVVKIVEFLNKHLSKEMFRDLLKNSLQCAAVNHQLQIVEYLLQTFKSQIDLEPLEAKAILNSIGARWGIDISAILEENIPVEVHFGGGSKSLVVPRAIKRGKYDERNVSVSLVRIIQLLSSYTTDQRLRADNQRWLDNLNFARLQASVPTLLGLLRERKDLM